VEAFSKLIQSSNFSTYDFTLRETQTYAIINDVANFYSEVGVLYLNDFNRRVITKLLTDQNLTFTELFTADPHIFISNKNPLATREYVTIGDLEEYPFLCFEQGTNNSFYFAEEILSTLPRKKVIHVSDRATLFNLLIGLNGYTICTGVLNTNLNGSNIVSVPLKTDETMTIGYIVNDKAKLSPFAVAYIEELKKTQVG
jgi:hypothetical protein